MSPNNIEQILEMGIAERTLALCSQVENQWFERKSINVDPKMLARSIIALANSEGGTVVVGIENKKVQDIAHETRKLNKLRQVVNTEFIVPAPQCSIEECDVLDENGECAQILLFHVLPGTHKLYRSADGKCFQRMGDSSVVVTREVEREMEYEREINDFEAELLPCGEEDLDPELLDNFLRMSGSTRGVRHLLMSRGLLDASGKVTNAAYLLFAKNPSVKIAGSHIRVIRFHGRERLTGSRQNIIFDERTDLPIPYAIEQAIEWIVQQIPNRRSLGDNAKFS